MYANIGYLGEYARHVQAKNGTDWRQQSGLLRAGLLADRELAGVAA